MEWPDAEALVAALDEAYSKLQVALSDAADAADEIIDASPGDAGMLAL